MREIIKRLQGGGRTPRHMVMDQVEPMVNDEPLWTSMGESFSVRMAQAEDLPLFIDLEEDAYNGFHAWTKHDFESDWNRNPYCVYIFVEETTTHEVVGMISGRFLAKGAHISHLLIRQAYQGRALGTQLLDLWVRLVKSENIPQITLEVRESNEIAQRLYYNYNFKHVKTHKNYYSDNKESAFYLKKEMSDDGSYI